MHTRTGILGDRLSVTDLLKYLLGYVCWAITAAVGLASILLTRMMLNVAWPALGGNRWVMRSIDRFGLVLMGIVWLAYVIYLEHYYRTGIAIGLARRNRAEIEQHKSKLARYLRHIGLYFLARRFALALGIPVALGVVSYLIQQLAFGSFAS
jgi:hypothetical protein